MYDNVLHWYFHGKHLYVALAKNAECLGFKIRS